MKKNNTTPRLHLLPLALIAAGLALPLPALPQTVELATSPMTTSTTTTVKPNMMFVLDDSGSMDWDYMPDNAKNFAGNYGYNTSQCNGVYYNPAITYSPPVSSTGAALNATATTFNAAYKDGFNTGAGTTNLNTEFTGGSGTGDSGISLDPGPAFYYTYSGTQTTPALQNYFNTSSTFYQECNSDVGTAPGNAVFTKFRLAAIPTTTLTITGAGGVTGATIKITSVSNKSRISSVTVNGQQILNATTSESNTANTIATNIRNGINACTTVLTGNCQVTGYSATVAGATVTLIGPAAAGGFTPAVTVSQGNAVVARTAFPPATPTTVNSITVNGTQLLPLLTTATGTTTTGLATDIKNKINANVLNIVAGYSATVNGNTVTITAPTTASNATPVINVQSGTMTVATQPFPESTPAKLQNFANWYSYYSTRMLMMKTGAGLAFNNVSDKYRVGFLTMNNNVSPGIVEVNTFDANQRLKFFTKLYAANPGDSTPLREALSKVGQYYAHKFGNITTYKSTITVGGSGSTEVESMKVNGIEIMEDQSVASNNTSTVARNIANQINAMQVTDFGAKAVANVITITGPATANGFSPVITKSGSMTFGTTTFSGSTTTAQLNGITPADPIQYSCQQNFTILSTDGYWNGSTTYDLTGGAVGQVDGTAVRPYNDGAQSDTTVTTQYTRNNYSTTASRITGQGLGGDDCDTVSKVQRKRTLVQPEVQSCTSTNGGPAVCTGWSNNGLIAYFAPYTSDKATCVASPTVPSPDPSVAVAGTPVTTTGTKGGVANTLSDVALYYYQTDLRNPALANCTGALGTSVCEDNVFISGTDNNLRQHMTTFTLGLGARGRMVYSSSYLTDTSGDYFSVKTGATASSSVCTWQTSGTVCNWPNPSSGAIENIDDLWHAAINGRGAFFSATDPISLANGLSNALTAINSKVGSAAAAATSTLNPVAGNNQAFVASYTTLTWEGNLEARGINTDTGVVSENATWCAENVVASSCSAPGTIVADSSGDTTAYFCVTPNSVVCVGGDLNGTDCRVPVATACTGTMNARVTAATDTRSIKTPNAAGNALIDFDTAYAAANASYFNASKLAGLSQWPAGSSTAETAMKTAMQGDNLIKYLRGQWGHEFDRSGIALADQYYRNRQSVLGDALESQPAFIGAPVFSYPYNGYTEFKAAQSGRGGTVYMGTNDGMMHAFDSATGQERWAFVPSVVIPNMWKLADKQYADKHTNYVNGSPVTTDICTLNCANAYNVSSPSTNPVWKTILVAGLNGGGRGYFALDITNPATPLLLWEFTTTTGIGAVKDADLGYTFGQPVVTRKSDGTWVVLATSGYDNGTDSATKVSGSFVANTPTGSGGGFLYVLNAGTGAMISKIATGAGTAAAPSGLAKIAGFNAEPTGNRASWVYGGDLLGNLWRFDINAGTVLRLATLFADTGATTRQPIMTTPVLGEVLGKRVVFIGTGKYLEVSDLSTTTKQTQYAIKDDDATTTLANPRTTLVQQFLIANPDGTATRLSGTSAAATGAGANPVDFGSGRGWFVDLPDSRERVNIDARLVLGTLLVPSIVPSATECSPGGTGWLNFFDYRTGASVTTTGIASGKYDSPIVGVNVLFIDGSPVVEVVTSTEPTPKIDPTVDFKATAGGFSGKRMLWRELIPQD